MGNKRPPIPSSAVDEGAQAVAEPVKSETPVPTIPTPAVAVPTPSIPAPAPVPVPTPAPVATNAPDPDQPKIKKIPKKDLPPELGGPTPEIVSPEQQEENLATFDLLMTIRRLFQSIKDLEALFEVIRQHSPVIQERTDIMQVVSAASVGLLDLLEKQAIPAAENLTQHVRDQIPRSSAPKVFAKRDEWHIKFGFSYPDPDDLERSLAYGPGEPAPPNLTEGDAQDYFIRGFLLKRVQQPGGEITLERHPQIKELVPGEAEGIMNQSVNYVLGYLTRTTLSLQSLHLLQIEAAKVDADNRIKDLIMAQLARLEAA